MKTYLLRCLASMALLFLANAAYADFIPMPANAFITLAYHEVRDDVRDYPDPYAVDGSSLVTQFAWLRENGYHPVSLQQIITARQGGTALPDKAVLLSFDDAYLSFYTHVYPLLREFQFAAVLGVVGNWIEHPKDNRAVYGEKSTVPDASFPTWKELREMSDSGLVEIISHTYDLHHGILANPQGNLQAAATSRLYDATTNSYEDDAHWRTRVRADLAHNADLIQRETGHRPRAVVWPYGSYNDELVSIAKDLGSPIALTLVDGVNTADIPLNEVHRTLIEHDPSLSEFIGEVRGPQNPEPIRAVQINLDDIYSADPVQQERNLSAMLDRIQVFKPTYVYVQVYADTNADGIADALYFPNHQLPIRADLFNRTAWQLATRTDAKVFAVLPLKTLKLPQADILKVYEDLSRDSNFDGLVFDDDMSRDAASLVFTQQLAAHVSAFHAPMLLAPSLSKTVHMLHGTDDQALAQQMRALQLGGNINFGYVMDEAHASHNAGTPDVITPAISLRLYPLPVPHSHTPELPLPAMKGQEK